MRYADLYREIRHGDPTQVGAWVREVLAEIVAGRRELSAVLHPLGFLCLPVLRSGDEGVCVHVWSSTLDHAESTTSEIHCHSWDLLSYVLYGSIRNEVLKVSDTETDPTHQLYEVRGPGDVDEVRAIGRLVSYEIAESRVSGAGEAYTLTAGEFHNTVVEPGGETATVALGVTRPGGADLSLGPIGGRTHRVRRRRCGPERTVSAAALVSGHLGERRTR